MAAHHNQPEESGRACSIIPRYLLSCIAESDANSSSCRSRAQNTLNYTGGLRQIRTSPSSESHGIIPQYTYNAISDSDIGATKEYQGTHPTSRRLFRIIYNAEEGELPGERLFKEGEQSEALDTQARQVYEHLGSTYNFFYEVFGRNGIYDEGGTMVGSVHYCSSNGGFLNAIYHRAGNVIFGDGDGEIFDSFTSTVGGTAHEVTHGMLSYTSGLKYEYQAGALTESLCDVFGSMVKQWTLQQTSEEADWLIGEGIFLGHISRALRSMKNPGTAYDNPRIGRDLQPASMVDYQNLPNDEDADFGGVHILSGIPNRVFYLVAVALGGYSWERAGPIWWDAINDRGIRSIDTKTAFRSFADLTCKHAQKFGSEAVLAVQQAWADVHVYSHERLPQITPINLSRDSPMVPFESFLAGAKGREFAILNPQEHFCLL